MPSGARVRLARLLRDVRFELLPLSDALSQSVHLPAGAEVAVTADPGGGMDPTIDLAVELSHRGFQVIPHLAAQLFGDSSELRSHLDRLRKAGIERALVVGGVSNSPGEFLEARALMDAIEEIGSSLSEIGIAGYPEGHHVIPVDPLESSLVDKASVSAWITTQICFDVGRTAGWIGEQRSRGIGNPIWLGIPAVAGVAGLMSLGMRIGAGRSLQFMFEHPKMVARLLRPGGRRASELVLDLGELAADDSLGIAGFHLFTYNQVSATECWRHGLLGRLE